MVIELAYGAGVALATLAAFASAIYFLCVRIGTDNGRVLDVVLISLLVNVILIVPIVSIMYGLPSITLTSILAFSAAGIVGSFLARLFIAKSIESIGASRTAPVVSANVFFASILAIVLFDERLTPMHVLGIILIVAGVAVITWEMSRDDTGTRSIRELGLSLILPVAAAMLIGVEPIFVMIGLDHGSPVLPGVMVKAIAATCGFVGYLLLTRTLRADMIQWDANTKWYVGAGVTSTTAITAYFAALSLAPVVIVVPLIQTAPLLVLVLSALFLPQRLERITVRLVAGASIVVLGAAMVSVYAV